jgi:hypothetical protein
MMRVDHLDLATTDDPRHSGDVAELDEPLVPGVLQQDAGPDCHLRLLPVPRARDPDIDTRPVQTQRKLHALVIRAPA